MSTQAVKNGRNHGKKNSTEEVPMGVIAQEIYDVIMELDKDGQRLLKDEAKNKRQ